MKLFVPSFGMEHNESSLRARSDAFVRLKEQVLRDVETEFDPDDPTEVVYDPDFQSSIDMSATAHTISVSALEENPTAERFTVLFWSTVAACTMEDVCTTSVRLPRDVLVDWVTDFCSGNQWGIVGINPT